MPGLKLNLLGQPSLVLPEGAPAGDVRAAKCVALLAYLALEPGPHPREVLATLLWGESPDMAARTSLRQALKQLRLLVGDVLRIDRRTVELLRPVDCDVQTFLDTVSAQPEAAAEFNVSRFMAGFVVARAPAFEEWVAAKRLALQQRYAQALRAAARRAVDGARWADSLSLAERWLEADELSEEAAHLACEADYMLGEAEAARARLHAFRSKLLSEAGREPGSRLAALEQRIASALTTQRQSSDGAPCGPSFRGSLAGREAQWRELVSAWRSAEMARGGVVLIEGEVGLGKSRLAEDFLRWVRAEGGTTLTGRGDETGVPYRPVVEALRSAQNEPGVAATPPEWLREVTRVLPDLRRRFPGLPEPAQPSDVAERWRLFEGVAQMLLALASERTAVMLIDDLQWCDGETCALLHFLARRIEESPVLLVATVRLGDLERDAPAARWCRSLKARSKATVINLRPLTEEELHGLIRELAGLQPHGGRRFAARLHAATDGNPFHVVELLKTLFSRGMLAVGPDARWFAPAPDADSGAEEMPMPPTVREAIGERVARLPYQLRDLLATVSVAGTGVSSDLLGRVHGISRLHAAALCDELADRHLLREDAGLYRAAHPVLAEVVRDSLTAPRGAEVHRALALSLADTTPEEVRGSAAGLIARHAERGGERAMAYRYSLMASEEAVRGYAFEEALHWLDRAAEAASPGEEADAVNRCTADVLEMAGWADRPARRGRRISTPMRAITQMDLDLGG